MATTVYEGELFSVTRYAGGAERGICYQIDMGMDFLQLTAADADLLARVLRAELDSRRPVAVCIPPHPNHYSNGDAPRED